MTVNVNRPISRRHRLAALIFISCALAAGSCSAHSGQPAIAPPAGVGPAIASPAPGIIADTWDGIHSWQVFDAHIPPMRATQHAPRYEVVWGTRGASAWLAGNPSILPVYYAVFSSDFTFTHDLKWWQGHHPDWILYRCDEKTPAWPSGLKYVPLDISNPAVVQWQIQTYAPAMENGSYAALGADLVGLDNSSGGCGVLIQGVWTPRFTGQKSDEAWAQAVLAWVASAESMLHAEQPRPIFLGVNTVPESRPFGDPDEDQLLNNVDFVDDESAFSNYGNQFVSIDKVSQIIAWMQYIQQTLDKPFLVDDKWNSSTTSQQQLGWSIGTYMLGKYHLSTLFTDHAPGYGYEYWHTEYDAPVGRPCSDAVTDPVHKGIFTRVYQGAYVLVNASATQSFTLTLPKPSYRSIFGGSVTSPVTIPPDTGDILLTSHGCS